MPTGWDSILTVILFGDSYIDGLEMLLRLCKAKSQFQHVVFFDAWLFQFIVVFHLLQNHNTLIKPKSLSTTQLQMDFLTGKEF